MFVGTIVGGRGAPWCCQPVGRRFRFDPCTPGWFGVGRLACGLFTVKSRLQLRCCWFRGCLGHLMVGLVCVGSIALLPVVVPLHVVYAAGMSVSVLVSGVVVCPSVVLCSLLPLVGRVCIGSVVAFCCVCGYDRRWAWRTTVLPTRWAPFPFRPVHTWLVRRWPACVWSVYGQVVAAAVVWLVRGCRGRLMVGRVCVWGPLRCCRWSYRRILPV